MRGRTGAYLDEVALQVGFFFLPFFVLFLSSLLKNGAVVDGLGGSVNGTQNSFSVGLMLLEYDEA